MIHYLLYYILYLFYIFLLSIQSEDFHDENIAIKRVFIYRNPYICTTVVQEVYNWDRSPDVDDVKGLAAAATKHLELLKQKSETEINFIIEKIVGKLLRTQNTRPFQLYLPQ